MRRVPPLIRAGRKGCISNHGYVFEIEVSSFDVPHCVDYSPGRSPIVHATISSKLTEYVAVAWYSVWVDDDRLTSG